MLASAWGDLLWAALAWVLIGVLGVVGGTFVRHAVRRQPWRFDVTIRKPPEEGKDDDTDSRHRDGSQ